MPGVELVEARAQPRVSRWISMSFWWHADDASGGPRARSAAAATASPSYGLGSAWVLSGLDWKPALTRLGAAFDAVAA